LDFPSGGLVDKVVFDASTAAQFLRFSCSRPPDAQIEKELQAPAAPAT